jgi:Fe2+ or Zn2+ uptake regulation protein
MPITKKQGVKILAYGQAGFTPQRILETMQEIGEPVSKSTLYRHLARMRPSNPSKAVCD